MFQPSYMKNKNNAKQYEISAELLDIKEIRNVYSVAVVGSLVMMRVPDKENNKLILLEYASLAI